MCVRSFKIALALMRRVILALLLCCGMLLVSMAIHQDSSMKMVFTTNC
jgi:hypothetical protein